MDPEVSTAEVGGHSLQPLSPVHFLALFSYNLLLHFLNTDDYLVSLFNSPAIRFAEHIISL